MCARNMHHAGRNERSAISDTLVLGWIAPRVCKEIEHLIGFHRGSRPEIFERQCSNASESSRRALFSTPAPGPSFRMGQGVRFVRRVPLSRKIHLLLTRSDKPWAGRHARPRGGL